MICEFTPEQVEKINESLSELIIVKEERYHYRELAGRLLRLYKHFIDHGEQCPWCDFDESLVAEAEAILGGKSDPTKTYKS